jgi:DNA-binding NarL/FixJ family response regulator
MAKITLLVVDDHLVVRQGLRALLELYPDFEMVGEAGDGSEAIAMAKRTQPDVVLMDVVMPGQSGCDATRQVLKVAPRARVLALSFYNDENYLHQMVDAGASGYLLKQDAAERIVEAIRNIRNDVTAFSPAIARRRRKRKKQTTARASRSRRLTAREAEVLQLIADGFSNPDIALQLRLPVKTVESIGKRFGQAEHS